MQLDDGCWQRLGSATAAPALSVQRCGWPHRRLQRLHQFLEFVGVVQHAGAGLAGHQRCTQRCV